MTGKSEETKYVDVRYGRPESRSNKSTRQICPFDRKEKKWEGVSLDYVFIKKTLWK